MMIASSACVEWGRQTALWVVVKSIGRRDKSRVVSSINWHFERAFYLTMCLKLLCCPLIPKDWGPHR